MDLVGQFCAAASSDILADALPESLKNMLLVMDTSGRWDQFFVHFCSSEERKRKMRH